MIQDITDLTSFRWGSITSVAPLAVKLDGDAAALSLVPDTLVDPLTLAVSDRVRVELSERKVVIHGVNNGGAFSGEMKMVARATAPSGWLLCQGQSLLRSDYPRLFAAIGTVFGAADSTHFNVPDLRGRTPVGQDASQTEFDVLGEKGGQKTTNHGFYLPGINSGQAQVSGTAYENASLSQLTAFLQAGGSSAATMAVVIQSVGGAVTGTGSGAIEVHHGRYTAPNLQPYIALNFIIKI